MLSATVAVGELGMAEVLPGLPLHILRQNMSSWLLGARLLPDLGPSWAVSRPWAVLCQRMVSPTPI